MTSLRLAIGFVAVFAGTVPAQSMPPITKAKRAAERAVSATNAHTAAVTAPVPEQGGRADSARADSARKSRAAASTGDAGAPSTSESAGASTRTAGGSTAESVTSFEREVFRYERAGRRDPFVSLMENGDLRPVLTDLLVVGILEDPRPGQSIAVLRDTTTRNQYRLRVGESVGRMRIARIQKKSVTFTIEEFGYSRQETLALSDPKKEREQ